MKKQSKWREIFDKRDKALGLRVFIHDVTGNIRVVYPKNVPAWAQKAALQIFQDIENGGVPTNKGVRDVVKKGWGYLIAKARN